MYCVNKLKKVFTAPMWYNLTRPLKCYASWGYSRQELVWRSTLKRWQKVVCHYCQLWAVRTCADGVSTTEGSHCDCTMFQICNRKKTYFFLKRYIHLYVNQNMYKLYNLCNNHTCYLFINIIFFFDVKNIKKITLIVFIMNEIANYNCFLI